MKNHVIRVAESQKAGVSSARHAANISATPVEADSLSRIAALAEEFSDDQIWGNARSAAERIAEGRFYVACVGQFKRGKSTLLNIPVTAVPTILRFGEHRQARVPPRSGE